LKPAALWQWARTQFSAPSGDLIWNLLSVAVLGASGILLSVIIAYAYGPAALGQFNLVFAAYIVFSQVGAMGLHLSVLKHAAEFSDDPLQCAVVIRSGLLACTVFALGSAAFFALAAPVMERIFDSANMATSVLLAAPGLALFSINKYLLATLNALSRLRLYAAAQALRPLGLLGGVALCYGFGRPAHEFGAVFTFAEAIVFIAAAPFVAQAARGHGGVRHGQWLRRHLKFGVSVFPGNLLIELNSRLDVLVLGLFLSDRLVGIYSFAAVLAEGVYQLPLVVRTILNARLVTLLAKRDHARLRELVSAVSLRTAIAMFGVAIVTMAAFPIAIDVLRLSPDLHEGSIVLAILLAGIVVGSGYVPFGNVLMQGGMPARHSIATMSVIFGNILLTFALVPPFGLVGAAVAMAATFASPPLVVRFVTRRYLGFSLGRLP
jgi:O-antigen/teichoic acid export membrane protein